VSAVLSLSELEGRGPHGSAQLERPGAPSVSLVILASPDDRETWQAIDVVVPMAAGAIAELVVVLRDGAADALWERVAAHGATAVGVGDTSTRTEMCDAAMAVVHGDIVLFREATTMRAGSLPAGLMRGLEHEPGADSDTPIALHVEPEADIAPTMSPPAEGAAGRTGVRGAAAVFRENERNQVAAAD
jgi:hypothetical protein